MLFVAVAACLGAGARATLPSTWETVCSTYLGDKREGACPVPARREAAMAVEGGRYVHVFGGSGGRVPRSDLWTYDSAARAWALGNADWREESADWAAPVCAPDPAHPRTAPAPRTGGVVAPEAGGLLFVGGGACRQYAAGGAGWDAPAAPVADYWHYARPTQQWARAWPAAHTLPNTTRFSTVAHAGRLYVFGGVDNTTDPEHPIYSNALWEISENNNDNDDGDDDQQQKEENEIRFGNNNVFANNGVENNNQENDKVITKDKKMTIGKKTTTTTTTTLRTTTTTKTKTKTARLIQLSEGSPVPPARAEHTAVVAGGKMYVFGGRNATDAHGDMWAYSFAERAWAVVPAQGAAPLPRYAHAAAVCAAAAPDLSDVVVVWGGTSGLALLGADVHAYSVGQRTWVALAPNGDAPSRRTHASLACGPNGELWLFGGVDESGRVLNDFYRMY